MQVAERGLDTAKQEVEQLTKASSTAQQALNNEVSMALSVLHPDTVNLTQKHRPSIMR
jgi:hypothetical protein